MPSIQRLTHSPIFLVSVFFVFLSAALGVSRITHSSTSNDIVASAVLVETLGDGGEIFVPEYEQFVARVEAAQRVELGFDIASRLVSISKKEGEAFVAGEILAQLDTARLQARQTELRATRDRAVASLDLAKSSLKRTKGLRTNSNVSAQALDEAIRQRQAAEADLAFANAQLSSIKLELQKSVLKAPFDGVVIERLSDVGRTMSVGLPVLLVEQSAMAEIRASLPLRVAQKLAEGQAVRLEHSAGVFEAKVDRIKFSLSGNRASDVFLHVADIDERGLVPGEILSLQLRSDRQRSGLWLLIEALSEYGRGLWSVYLAEPLAVEGEANSVGDATAVISRKTVMIDRFAGDYVLVRGGLAKDDLPNVVLRATHRIVANQKVRYADQNAVIVGAQ